MKKKILQPVELTSEQIELGFMSRSLAQVSLPHSKPETSFFQRSSGIATLSISSTNPDIGLPYGTYPRLLLAWICTEAIKKQSPILHLGTNQTDFLKRLDLDTGGSQIKALKEQANRLLTSVFRLEFADRNIKGFKQLLLANSAFEFWEPRTGEWESKMELSKQFFDDIMNRPVPLDLNVLQALRKSPMAMDVYTWLIYRSFSVNASRRDSVKISWADLALQFGAGYSDSSKQGLYDFKKKFIEAVQKVNKFYPDLQNITQADSQFLTVKGYKWKELKLIK